MGETAALFLCFMLVMCVHLGRADSVDDLLAEALEGETNPTHSPTPTPTPVSSSGSASIARKELKVMQNRVIKVLRDGARRDRKLKVLYGRDCCSSHHPCADLTSRCRWSLMRPIRRSLTAVPTPSSSCLQRSQ